MKKIIYSFLFFTVLIYSNTTFAFTNFCNVGYSPIEGMVTYYHDATWSTWDLWDDPNYYDYVVVITDATAPIPGHANTFYEDVNAGGFVFHHLHNPPDGSAAGTGSIEVSGQYDFCAATGFINNIPDPVFTSAITFSPNPAIVGQSVTANWSTQNATSGCTLDGSPISPQGPLTFTAAMADSRSYTILCAAAGQPTASDTENLTVWECDTNTNPPTFPNSSILIPQQTNSVIAIGVVGKTQYFQDKFIDCYQVCQSHSNVWKLGGFVRSGSSSYSLYSTKVQAPSCAASNRTVAHITLTSGHELIHSQGVGGQINESNGRLLAQPSYTSQAQCLAAKAVLDFDINFDFDTENTRQSNHLDHIAVHYPKTSGTCNASGVTVEFDDGTY